MDEARISIDEHERHAGLRGALHNIDGMRITQRSTSVELHFPQLRAAGSVLMLALFGAACCVIGGAASSGLLHSDVSPAARLLAFAFGGVLAVPLIGLGVWFVSVAIWTAANSLTVEISAAGVRTKSRFVGYPFATRMLRRAEITAVNVQPAAKYAGIFAATRHYRVYAASRDRALLLADNLPGSEVAANVRKLILEELEMPELAAVSNKAPDSNGPEV